MTIAERYIARSLITFMWALLEVFISSMNINSSANVEQNMEIQEQAYQNNTQGQNIQHAVLILVFLYCSECWSLRNTNEKKC